MTSAEARARATFRARFGREPAGTAFAPGRVNLIGEHVDYNDGLVLPMALADGTAVAWTPRADGRIVVTTDDFAEDDAFELGHEVPPPQVGWRSYVRGMAACARDQGIAGAGADLVIAGTVPRGAGLSSSASLCVAVGRALAAAAGVVAEPLALARAAQQAEHDYAGVRCGIMDQLAAAIGKPREAILIDCRTLRSEAIPVPPQWAVLVALSGIHRGLVDGEYNARRAQCEAAARALGVASLRDATPVMVETSTALDPVLRRRARHVVSEIARTVAAAAALRESDLVRFGALLREGQRSLRDDFETSVEKMDDLVAILERAIGSEGGARMTGGGFGGAAIALVPREMADWVREAALRGYASPGGEPPTITAY